ncbi:uncharacterized protein N7515_004332 [Penicillium bovifimosum]|uniref:Uncharacterized protein n=1 Tax=Penicillium bovifimosum TaxID=126998 RepID=A0A9W9GZX2_9EURO|nr:uncharacterized protein N7515_004332 [Penicillium bovifimosum]KAJ5135054.1 hypothetical protein N7515_004332 [Penicillium bovifimosum]
MEWVGGSPPATNPQGAQPFNANDVQGLYTLILDMQQRLQELTANATTVAQEETQRETRAPAPMRPTYPDATMFSGNDRKEYDVFRMNLNTKFEMDAHFFPTEAKRVLYAFGRLTGKASQPMMPWMRSHGMPTKTRIY